MIGSFPMRPEIPQWLSVRLLRQFLRYGIVGISVSVLYSLTVIVLVSFLQLLRPPIASVVAFFCVMPVGFLSHRHYSFASKEHPAGQVWRFVATNVSSFLVSVGGMYVVTDILQISYLFGIAWAWVAVPAVNFLIYLFWVFGRSANGRLPWRRN